EGVDGVQVQDNHFLKEIEKKCKETGAILILDEVQSGYGRSIKVFVDQFSGIKPDLITVAKGMGNGFPVACVLISSDFNARHGMLGTTFAGNHLACRAGIAVLDIIKEENLIENAATVGA